MRFKRIYMTHDACKVLGVHKYTLWRWADQGKIRMKREGPQKVRVFDADEIDSLAPKIPKERHRGFSVFPLKK